MSVSATPLPKRFKLEKEDILDNFLFHKFQTKYHEHRDKTYDQFVSTIAMFNVALIDTVIQHRDGVELPESLGNIFIGSCQKAKKKNVNYAETKRLGTVVYHSNIETDGHLAKIFYTNYNEKYKFRNRELWQFNGANKFSKAVSKAYRVDWKKYVVIDASVPIHKIYLKRNVTMARKKSEAEYGVYKYNEFDIQ